MRRNVRSPNTSYCDVQDHFPQLETGKEDLSEFQLEHDDQIRIVTNVLNRLTDEHRVVISLYNDERYGYAARIFYQTKEHLE